MGIARRLFIFDYNNLDKALRQFRDNLMEEDDYYLIIKRDDIKLSNNTETALKVLLKKGEGEVKDTKELPDASYNAFVIAMICNKINKKTNVYYIACPEIYDFTKKHIERNAGYLCQKTTLSCVKHNEFIDVNDTSDTKVKESYENKSEHTKKTTHIENENSEFSTKSEKKIKENINRNDDSGLGDALDDINFNSSNPINKKNNKNSADARAPDKKKFQSSASAKTDKTSKKQQEVENKDEDIRSIEKKIFFSAKIEEFQEREYTEIDDDKFRILTSTFERLKKHLSIQIKNEEDLTDEDYEQIVIYLIKSEDLKDFNNSKDIAKLKADIEMESDSYRIFKSESEYYIKMCDLFYREDKY